MEDTVDDEPLYSLPQFHLRRFNDSIIDLFSSLSDVFPIVERLDSFMGLNGVMPACTDNVYCFRNRPEDI